MPPDTARQQFRIYAILALLPDPFSDMTDHFATTIGRL
jgi:hypothetical protein